MGELRLDSRSTMSKRREKETEIVGKCRQKYYFQFAIVQSACNAASGNSLQFHRDQFFYELFLFYFSAVKLTSDHLTDLKVLVKIIQNLRNP